MLSFWYSERCTRQIKLLICIITCAIIYAASSIEKLAPIFVGIALVIGVCTHLIHLYQAKIHDSNPYKQGLQILNYLVPIFAVSVIITKLSIENRIFLSIQVIGFMLLGLFILSIYQNRAKRF